MASSSANRRAGAVVCPCRRGGRRAAVKSGAPARRRAGADTGGGCPFHIAIPVDDLERARAFYGGALGLEEGRRSETWQDYNMHGHQLVVHEVKGYEAAAGRSQVDGDPVPVPHYGLVLTKPAFDALVSRLDAAGAHWEVAPHLRFEGQPGEQWTGFLYDPAGNALELKAMATPANLFARYDVDAVRVP